MKKLIAVAAIALFACGCDPHVLVRSRYWSGIARIYLKDATTGEFVGMTKTETASNITVTVVFEKKGGTK